MKKLMVALASALMMLSCTSEEPKAEKPTGWEQKTITFTFGDMLTQHAMTRADVTELDLTDLWMFDYVGDELQQTIHQASTDDGFGSISVAMNYGTHTLYFVASRGTTPTTDTEANTIIWAKPSDTYWATTSIPVAPSSASAQAVSLGRVATRLRITVTDEVPTGAALVQPNSWSRLLNGIMASIIRLAMVWAFSRTIRVKSLSLPTISAPSVNSQSVCSASCLLLTGRPMSPPRSKRPTNPRLVRCRLKMCHSIKILRLLTLVAFLARPRLSR